MLRDAGLTRITVSLDAMDDPTSAAVIDAPYAVAEVTAGMDAAEAAGFPAVKVNAVVRHGVNEHAIVDLARLGRDTARTVRFIEFMDVGTTNGWDRAQVVTADDLLAPGAAERYRYRDGAGELGVIASVTRALPNLRPCPPVGRRRALHVAVRDQWRTTRCRSCATATGTSTASRWRCATSGRSAATATRWTALDCASSTRATIIPTTATVWSCPTSGG